MSSVRLENISRRFGDYTAVEDIDFTVGQGELWVLVGPSGCGKSTILRTIAGLEAPSSGNVYIDNQRVNDIPGRQRDVAMVFQNYALYPHMSVAKNIGFGLRMRGVAQETIDKRIQEVAQILNIQHLLDRKPRQLSGGQQQRVALGRAIARQPRVFLLDEPLSNLDAQLRDDTRAELKQLHAALGITTIYVTHDQVEAMTLADRMVVLDQGKIQQIGTPQSVYERPANRMVAKFLGSPPMNLLPAQYHDNYFYFTSNDGTARLPVADNLAAAIHAHPQKTLEVGIRPEHIQIGDTAGENVLSLSVQVVEPLGRETLIRASIPGNPHPLNVQVNAAYFPQPGDRLLVSFPSEKLFLFDPDTGKTIYPSSESSTHNYPNP